MKKYVLFALLIIGALTSCTKTEMSLEEKRIRTQGDLTYTIQIDSMKEVSGKDTLVFNFSNNEEVHAKWMFDLWWGDANGNVMPTLDGDFSGHGVRFTPIDPNNPNGEQVLIPFTWYTTVEGDKIIANIGGNIVEIIIIGDKVIMHQLANRGRNTAERWYFGMRRPNATNMKGNGAKRPG